MGKQDWNDVDSSDSQSSDDNNEQQEVQNQSEQKPTSKQQHAQTSSKEKVQVQTKKAPQTFKQKPKFPTDEELLQKIKSKQIQERRKIKIVNCRSEELIEMIKSHKLISYLKDITIGDRPTFYIASFKTEDDLIAFIEEKIDNRYRFFLHPYIRTQKDIAREKQRQERYKQRAQQDHKQRDRYNDRQRQFKKPEDDGKRRGRNRPEYDEEQQQTKKRQQKGERRVESKTRQTQSKPQPKPTPKQQPKPVQQKAVQQKSKPVQQKPVEQKPKPAQTKPQQKPQQKPETSEPKYVIQKNQIKIFQNVYSKNRIVDEIVDKKITDKWDRIKIYVRKDGLQKVFELAELIYEKIGYGLKVLPDETSNYEFIEVVLETKCHVVHPNAGYVLLTDSPKKYFERVDIRNKFIISKEFSIDEYIKGFRANQKDITRNWNEWLIKAQGENIPNLLKLSWRLKKELYLNINMHVGSRNDIPFAYLEIQPESDKEKRPKVDASFVNSYLTN